MSFQFVDGTKVRVGEVQYFTRLAIQSTLNDPEGDWTFANVAILKLYSDPDVEVLRLSSQVLTVSCLLDDLFVCDVKKIHSVVAMIPRMLTLLSGIEGDFFCMMEKPGLDISDLEVPYSIYSQPGDDDDEGGDDVDVE